METPFGPCRFFLFGWSPSFFFAHIGPCFQGKARSGSEGLRARRAKPQARRGKCVGCVYIYISICVCVSACRSVCLSVCLSVCVCSRLCVCMCVRVRTVACVCVCACAHAPELCHWKLGCAMPWNVMLCVLCTSFLVIVLQIVREFRSKFIVRMANHKSIAIWDSVDHLGKAEWTDWLCRNWIAILVAIWAEARITNYGLDLQFQQHKTAISGKCTNPFTDRNIPWRFP